MSSESSRNFDNDFFNTAAIRDLVETSLRQMKNEYMVDPENNQKSLEINLEPGNNSKTSKVKMDSENNLATTEDVMDSENIQETPEVGIDFEFHENILAVVRQSLEEENTLQLRMLKEFSDKLDAFKNRIDNVLEDLEFIKMLALKANNRLDDSQTSEQKKPGTSPPHPADNL